MEKKSDVGRDEVISALERTADLIAPGCWVKSTYARSSRGYDLQNPLAKTAVKFCLAGGLKRVTRNNRKLYNAAIRAVHDVLPKPLQGEADLDGHVSFGMMQDAVFNYNDSEFRKRTEVVTKLRRGAEKLRAQR